MQALKRAAWLGCVMLMLGASTAHAWIFPEHMELTRFAYERDLPMLARVNLQAVLAAANRTGLRICSEVDPLERYLDAGRKCVPYSALPALAGDHANDTSELSKLIRDKKALKILEEVAERWQGFLESAAPEEVQRLYRSRTWRSDSWQPSWENGDAQRVFTRELDIALEWIDDDYSGRAKGSRAHFQDSLTPIGQLIGLLKARGNIDNALAQVFAHHIRSLQLAMAGSHSETERARDALWAEALLEHANALHFVQDAYASGHIGTEHRASLDVEKLRRHDFLNRAGLNAQRFTLGARCENVTAAGRNATQTSDPVKASCWVAFGDAYLDSYNARIIADAVARLQIQFAMAIGVGTVDTKQSSSAELLQRGARTDVSRRWLNECFSPTHSGRPLAPPKMAEAGRMMPSTEETTPDKAQPYVRFEGEGIAHVYRCKLGEADATTGKVSCAPTKAADTTTPGANCPNGGCRRLRVTVYSDVFDAQIAVRKCTDAGCGSPRKVASQSDNSAFDLQASATFEAESGAIYEFVLGNDGRTPLETGDAYSWLIVDPAVGDSKEQPPTHDCAPLVRVAELLDPAPVWSQTDEERQRRAGWSQEQHNDWARYIVQGAQEALLEVARLDRETCSGACERTNLSSGGTSGANTKLAFDEVIGDPLHPCHDSALWQERSHPHPFCSTSGGVFSFGAPSASLWRPVLAAWPTPMGDITVIEGKDAFGKGLAAEVIFGGGPMLQTWNDFGWVASMWLGFGASYRVNNLFPARENRALVELNFAFEPLISMHDGSRFQMAGFIEARFPLMPAILALGFGETFPVEWGPLGYRYYFQWPNQIPGGEGHWFSGIDVEFLNIDIGGGSGAQNREAGHILDLELRFRFGFMREWFLLGPDRRAFTPVLSAEVAWGHSTYFADL